jgi:hypothetical protein
MTLMNGRITMSTESGDPVADLGMVARWSWRRAERKAVADHERWLAANLDRLAAARIPVFRAADRAAGRAPAGTAGIVDLRLRGWQLLLAGVAAAPRGDLERAARRGRLHLDAAGRYGRLWWIEIVRDGAAPGEKVVLLGSHLRLAPTRGGHGALAAPRPAGRLGVRLSGAR